VQVFYRLGKALTHIKPAQWAQALPKWLQDQGHLAINPQQELPKFSYATLGNHPQENLAKF
jgi:hypothetical protein